MKINKLIIMLLFLPLVNIFSGCATNANNAPSSGEGRSKAEEKISMAIGQEIGTFTITNQQGAEAPAGYNATRYTVKTNGEKTYKCEILEPSGLGKFATWGMASGADAMCTDFTSGSTDQGKTNKASCNDLLRAAGKC